jgi:16S rRNA (uracil1498-N3)-methyltransferase
LHDTKDLRSKAARLEKIALAAAQQSRQTKPPAVIVTSTLSDALAVTEEAGDINPCKVLCSLSEGTVPIRAALSKWNDKAPIHIAIGPEGDLTLDEETLLSERGFMRVSLGESVLRSELAVVAAILAARERSIRPE